MNIFWTKRAFYMKQKVFLIIIFLFHHLVKKWQVLNLQFWSFGPNLPKKGIFGQKGYFWSKNRKSEHYHWIKHIRISPCTKFHFKQIILKFRPKFAQKGYFWLKTQKVNVIIELLWVPNFSLNGQFRFFEPNLPIKAISGLK